jgi:hypothetical protein
MQQGDCNCAFLALRTLARIEELTTSSHVPLETALQITSAAERPSLAVLNCERCRRQGLALTAVTILCTHLVEWLSRLWNLDNKDATEVSTDTRSTTTTTTTSTTSTITTNNTCNTAKVQNATHHATQHGTSPWRFSIGSYELAADEADALSNELMTLRLIDFSAVLGSLEAALVTSGPSLSIPSSPSADADGIALSCLDLVRANLRLVRAHIRHLKVRSLLNSSGATTTCD